MSAAAAELGVHEVRWLGYADSGHGGELYPDPPGRVRLVRAGIEEPALLAPPVNVLRLSLHVAARLRRAHPGLDVALVPMSTRGDEVLDMLQAMNTGHDGSMTTLHANSLDDALNRLELLANFAGFSGSEVTLRAQVASAIHLMVQVARLPGGERRVTQVAEVRGTLSLKPDGSTGPADAHTLDNLYTDVPTFAALSAPRAKMARSVATWRRITRSPGPAKTTSCSPTISPPRIAAKPMLPGMRAPVSPSRAGVRSASSAAPRPSAAASPSISAVPDGASTFMR